ncbi:MAG: hypothetical protein WCR42_05335 [bacterium]
MKLNKYIKFALLFITLSAVLNGCFIVLYQEHTDVAPKMILSPKPEVEMSDELVRSDKGDMIAFLPKDWFFIDTSNKTSGEVFTVAVNPKYNIAAVFSILPVTPESIPEIEKEGLVAVARMSFAEHKASSDKPVSLVGKYQIVDAGTLQFATYNFTTNGLVNASSAVFLSKTGTYYEFSLLPMVVNLNPLPEQKEFDKYFRSILATIKF